MEDKVPHKNQYMGGHNSSFDHKVHNRQSDHKIHYKSACTHCVCISIRKWTTRNEENI